MTDLTLYTNPMSRGRIARWVLEEAACDYATEIVAFGAPMHAPAYRAVNPMAKVPALRHGAVTVTEAGAICAYVADAFPDAGLAPTPGDPARGIYLRWMFFGAGPLEAAITNASLGWQTDDRQLQGRLGYGSLDRALDTLAGWLDGRPHILGETFSAADVYLGAQLGFALRFKTIPARPVFEDYAARMADRPAARRAAALDDALLAGAGPT